MKKAILFMGIVDRVIGKFSLITCAIGQCFIFVFMLLAIFGRLVGKDIEGVFEFSQFALAATAFLGLSYVQLIGGHVKMETLTSRLPKTLQQVFAIISILIAMAFFVLITWRIWQVAYADWARKLIVTGLSFSFPMWIHEFAAVVGCVLMLIVLLFQLVYSIANFVIGEELVVHEIAGTKTMGSVL